MKLTGKTALVTGRTSGIGLATAKLLASEGARVAVAGRDEARLDAATTGIGAGALAIGADVRSADAMRAVGREGLRRSRHPLLERRQSGAQRTRRAGRSLSLLTPRPAAQARRRVAKAP